MTKFKRFFFLSKENVVVRGGSEYYSAAYQLPVKHCACMLVRGEAEKPGQHLHRFTVLALVRARMADALHNFLLSPSIFLIFLFLSLRLPEHSYI